MGPVFNLVYYKNILNRCVLSFFKDKNDMFIKNKDGKYVYSETSDINTFIRYFKKEILKELQSHINGFYVLKPEYFLIIGGCEPRDNILMDFADTRFPAKLRRLIWADSRLKYILSEHDIIIDIEAFNNAANFIFNELFEAEKPVFGKGFENVIFIRHKNLDCYSMFKTLKYIFGKNSCVNIFKEKLSEDRQCIIAINDIIDKYVNRKTEMSHSVKFRNAIEEIRNFIELKIKI